MKRLKSIWAIIIAIIISLCAMPVTTAFAGMSSEEMAGNGFVKDGVISDTVFERITGDVIGNGETIVFGSNTQNTSVKARCNVSSKINEYENIDILATLETKININEIPANGEFLYAFGLPKRTSDFGTADSVEIIMTKTQTAYNMAVKVVGNDNTSSEKVSSAISTDNDGNLSLSVNIFRNKQISITATGSQLITVCDKVDLGVLPVGYFAFGYRTAKCKITVSELYLKTYNYEAPENVDAIGEFTEDFENGEYNANIWYSEGSTGAHSPSYLHVENRKEKDGSDNGVLRFNNMGYAHVTTRYKYSNFELNFDLMDVAYPTFDEDNNVLTFGAGTIYIITGVTNYREAVSTSIVGTGERYTVRLGGYVANPDYTKVSKECRVMKGNTTLRLYNFANDVNPYDGVLTNGRKTNVKVVMKDMQLRVWIKYEDSEWTNGVDGLPTQPPVITYTFGSTPLGHVRIGTACHPSISVTGGLKETAIANFSIDNLSIKNLDADNLKNLTTVDFKSNIYDLGSDYEYVDTDDSSDLLNNRLDSPTDSGCNGAVEPVIIVGLIAVIVALVMIKRRKAR